MRNTRIANNTAWMLFQQIYSMILSLVVGSVVARYLGPSNYGIITYGASLITLASTVAKLGLDAVIIKRLTDRPDDEGEIVGSALFLRSVASLLMCLTLNLIVYLTHTDEPILRIVIALQSLSIIFNVYEIIVFSFQAKLMYRYSCLTVIIATTVASLWKIYLAIAKSSIVLFATPTIVQSVLSFFIVFYFYKNVSKYKLSISLDEAKSAFKSGYHLLLSAIAVTVYTQIDKIMINSFLDSKAVGIYSAATVLAMLWEFIPQSIISTFRTIIYESKNDEKSFNHVMVQISTIIFWMSITVIVCYFLLGKLMIQIVYGQAYVDALIPLKIIVLSTGFAMFSTLRGVWMIANGVEKYDKFCVVWGSITNFLLNILFIPKFGIVGAAITTLIAQLVNGVIATFFYKETRSYLVYLRYVPGYTIKVLKTYVQRRK